MINDGYSLLLRIGNQTARFRPLLHNDRISVAEQIEHVGTQSSVASLLMDRIEWSTFDMDWLLGQPDPVFIRLWRTILGVGRSKQEKQDAEELRRGVRLRLRFPHIKGDICGFCREHWFDPVSGRITTPVLTKREGAVLCETEGESCPVGHWKQKNTLSAKNEAAFRHHMECRAVGIFPSDTIVQRNAAIIEEELDLCKFARLSTR